MTPGQQPSQPSALLFRLESHLTARSQAVTYSSLSTGTTVLSTTPLATVLIETEKGRRCDLCLCARSELLRCTGCKQHWYCDPTCQMMAWRSHHRRLCKRLQSFMTSEGYERLSSPERLHSLLLAHLLAEHDAALWSAFSKEQPSAEDLSDPISTLLSLLPRNSNEHVVPQVPLDEISTSLTTFLSCRFANNNFTIHSSRMDVFAHGIFPLASRSFNHSCVPSAVPVYPMRRNSKVVQMDIQLIRNMEPGEEITIPYTDPALPYPSRLRDLDIAYGFTCTCPRCQPPFSGPPPPPIPPPEVAGFETRLRKRVLPYLLDDDARDECVKLQDEFFPAFHSSYLPSLAEAFSHASHDGPYDIAVQKGTTLLALYHLIYPANYPMIGLHALELAKTCWNAFITDAISRSVLQSMKIYLALAEGTFSVLFGCSPDMVATEDDVEPVAELRLLKEMLNAETGPDVAPRTS